MTEKEYPIFKKKESNTSELMREQIVKILDDWNIPDVKIFSQMRDVIYTQQYKIFDKIADATCRLIHDGKAILVNYEINYIFFSDKNEDFEIIEKCNSLFYQGLEVFINAYKRMCRMDKAFSDYDFKYIYAIVRTKNPIQIEKTDQKQTLKITYKIDL
jgi:hypothetical protein